MPRSRPLATSALLLSLLAGGAAADDAAALIDQGQSKLESGEIDAGLVLFRQAAEQDPKSSLAQTRVGGALLLKQEYEPAIQAFRQAVMLDANNANAFIGMAMAHLHSGDYSLARATLEEAKRIDPAKQSEIDKVMAYIDRREAGGEAH